MQPFKPHFSTGKEPQPPTEQASRPLDDQVRLDTVNCPSKYVAMYNASSRKKSLRGSRDAFLRVSPGGNAMLQDADTDEILGASRILDASCLRPGRIVFVGKWRVQVQEHDTITATPEASGPATAPTGAAPTTESSPCAVHEPAVHEPAALPADIKAPCFGKPYRPPTRSIAPATYKDICEQCKAGEVENGCDGQTPCGSCLSAHEMYCCYLNTTGTTMLRYPSSPGAECADESQPVCENCRIFGRQCDRDGTGPCSSCLDNGRAYCTIVDGAGTVKSVLCSAYRMVENPNGSRRTAPRSGYNASPEEVWPTWPRAKPDSDTLGRIRNLFAAKDSQYNYLSSEELLQWFRSGAADLPVPGGS